MLRVQDEKLQQLLHESIHCDYYNLKILKNTLNILSYKPILGVDSTEEEILEKVNKYKNPKEFYEMFKLSISPKLTFKDMALNSLHEPIVEFSIT